MKRILWWLRRDLRLADNLVLHQALNDATAVIPVFVLDVKLLASSRLAPARKQFLFDALDVLDASLKRRGSYLVLRRGDAASELVQLARQVEADAVYYHADYTPYARKRDTRVVAALDRAGIQHRLFNDLYLADPNQVLKDDGGVYTVYSRYRVKFERVVAIPAHYETKRNLNTPPDIATLNLPAFTPVRNSNFACGGELAAVKLAQDFVVRQDGLESYGETRNALDADVTSHLSPHLHFGTISVRELVRMARETFPATPGSRKKVSGAGTAQENANLWIDELVWREFFNQILYHFPHAAQRSFRPAFERLKWTYDPEQFEAWRGGRTGYPIVDAGMRQLNATGWMHNRARMITASFLTKDLMIHWRDGQAYFLQNLIDGDMASNNGGWQWSAGTGTDAQPYFRIFNPTLQSARFDPRGSYIRRWVPELAKVPAQYIHAPWEMPDALARSIGVNYGTAYPKPIIDHAIQRERALAFYRQATSVNNLSETGKHPEKQL